MGAINVGVCSTFTIVIVVGASNIRGLVGVADDDD